MTTDNAFYTAYLESKQRIAEGKGDIRDDALVSAVDKTVKLVAQRKGLYQQLETAQEEVKQAHIRLRDLQHLNDIAESRVAVLTNGRIALYDEEVPVEFPTEH